MWVTGVQTCALPICPAGEQSVDSFARVCRVVAVAKCGEGRAAVVVSQTKRGWRCLGNARAWKRVAERTSEEGGGVERSRCWDVLTFGWKDGFVGSSCMVKESQRLTRRCTRVVTSVSVRGVPMLVISIKCHGYFKTKKKVYKKLCMYISIFYMLTKSFHRKSIFFLSSVKKTNFEVKKVFHETFFLGIFP